MKKNIKLLDNLLDPNFQKKMKNINIAGNQKFWNKQNQLMKEMEKKHKSEHKMIKMSHEKFIIPFFT